MDVWSSGSSYESYVGRWSRPVAAEPEPLRTMFAAAGLDEDARTALRERLRDRLPTGPDGSIPLTAPARVVRGAWR